MKLALVVDRFEGEFAILQNLSSSEMVEIRLNSLPAGLKEGSVITLCNDKFVLDEIATKRRTNDIKAKMDDLWE